MSADIIAAPAMPPARRRRLAVLGATGTVGRAALAVAAAHPERFEVVSLAAGQDAVGLAALARQHGARRAILAAPAAGPALADALAGSGIESASGPAALALAASDPEIDIVVAAIVGFAGLPPILAALEAGRTVAVATKEALISAGPLVHAAAARGGGLILPLDSEHNAAFQLLEHRPREHVARLILTASGGPFRLTPAAEMDKITPEQACRHPVWRMGRKISVDSATLMNKGLELIEAAILFDLPDERLDILVHPEVAVHALVELTDGSWLASLSAPDMQLPLAHALAWPDRLPTSPKRLDWATLGRMSFEPPDYARFRAPLLARDALRAGGTAPTILSAANEVAVAAFLDGQVGFQQICAIVEAALAEVPAAPIDSLDRVFEADARARAAAERWIERRLVACST